MKEKLSGQALPHSADFHPFMLEIVKSNQATTEAVVKMSENMQTLTKHFLNTVNDISMIKSEMRDVKKLSETANHNIITTITSVSNLNATRSEILEAAHEMRAVTEEIKKKLHRSTIDAEQQQMIVNGVNRRAVALQDVCDLELKHIKIILWTKLNERFNSNTYRELKTEDFYKAMSFLEWADVTSKDISEVVL